MEQSSPARLYAGVVGATLAVAGIVGFFYSSSFGSPGDVDAALGILDVNGWNNALHILTGALGLVAFSAGVNAARQYARAFGALYLAVAIWGLVIGDGESILGVIPVSTQGNVLYLLLALAGLTAGSRPEGRSKVGLL
jgi:hypothetical protein